MDIKIEVCDWRSCYECGGFKGEPLFSITPLKERCYDCGGSICLCKSCLQTFRTKIDALSILVQTGIDTKEE